MKNRSYIIGLLMLLACCISAQESLDQAMLNIVPNPDFEKYSATPIGWFYKGKHFTSVMKYWSSPTSASPDIFGPKVRVPAHWAAKGFGEQKAKKGNSMVGITIYGCENGKPHCREYVQIQLSEPLVLGQKYYAEFWVSHLARSMQSNNIGMLFADEKYNINSAELIPADPQINSKEIVAAPNNQWIKISGSFTAKEEASFLIIGNFKSDSLTQTKMAISNSHNFAYYYVDNVILKKEKPFIDVPIKEDDLSRITIEKGKVVQLRNIFFDTDKYELLPRSFIELNKLLELMKRNPSMVIEVGGHTDSTGKYKYNQYLSRKRAKAVVLYLIKHGISGKRTKYKGYGSHKPMASNQNEEGRQMNRRVEFIILSK